MNQRIERMMRYKAKVTEQQIQKAQAEVICLYCILHMKHIVLNSLLDTICKFALFIFDLIHSFICCYYCGGSQLVPGMYPHTHTHKTRGNLCGGNPCGQEHESVTCSIIYLLGGSKIPRCVTVLI